MIVHVNNDAYRLLRVFRKHPDDIEQAMYIDNLRNKNVGLVVFQDAQNYLICEEIEEATFSEVETKD